nr:tetratricopeptide repeat protein [Bradyrhizobium zhengyangense]
MGLGYTLKSLGRNDQALEAFLSAAKTAPTSTAAKTEAANILRETNRADDAIALLQDVVGQEPSNPGHLSAFARLLKQTGRNLEAAEAFRKLVAVDPNNTTYRIELGHILRDIEALDEALEVLDAVVEREPANASAWVALGWLHRKTAKPDLAADAFRRAVDLQPTHAGSLHALGIIERDRGNHEASLGCFNRAREADPKALYIRLEICNSLRNLGRFDDAVLQYREALELWPASRELHLGLGYALRSAGRSEEALAAFDAAAQDDLAHPNGSIEAGHVLLKLGRPADSAERFREALRRAPGNASALVGLSYAIRRLGQLEPAETALREVLAAQPGHGGARVALGHLLDSQYRLDEAAALFAEVIASQPDHADSHAALGNIHRRQGNRDAALASFRRAADAEPANEIRLLDIAVELRDLGRLDECAGVIDRVLASAPTEARALMQRGQLLRRQDRRADALAVFEQLISYHPDNAQAMVEAAAEERALGRPQLAKQWLDKALATETEHVGALVALAELAMQSDDAEAALGLYRRAAAAHPTNVWAWLGGARAAFETGLRDDAFRMIMEARERLGSHPEMAGMEIELLRQLREWTRAQQTIDQAMAEAPRPNFWLWSHKVQIATMTGDYALAEQELNGATPASSVTDHARVELLRGQLAEARFAYGEAIPAYQEAIGLNPGDAWAHFELARAALMSLDIDTSRKALANFIRVSRSSLLLKGQSLSPSQNHVGQLLDEFVLDADALAELQGIMSGDAAARFGRLRAMLAGYPDYTPAAMLLAIALRQNGQFAVSPSSDPRAESPIPRHIVQFWDRDPPDDVTGLMASWRELNPNHRWTCFDNDSAREFLRREFGVQVLRAYDRAVVPAQQADLFRLAWLAARGGIYADADDRCLAPIDSYLHPEATLAVHQENYGSIGNNFIAVTPEHPVIVRALDLGTAAMNRGDTDLVWLSTGPGLLTRAFALEWASGRPGGLLRRTQVLDLGHLQRVIGIHCPVRYKSTDRHWSRTAFRRDRRKGKSS